MLIGRLKQRLVYRGRSLHRLFLRVPYVVDHHGEDLFEVRPEDLRRVDQLVLLLCGHSEFLISENVGEQVVQLMQTAVVLEVGQARLQLPALDRRLVLHLLEVKLTQAARWPGETC